MFNKKFEIETDKHILIVEENKKKLLVDKIKTKRQRKFRTLIDFYEETNNIKPNKVDIMLRSYGIANKSFDELFKENRELVVKLGLDIDEIKVRYREALLNYIENTEFI